MSYILYVLLGASVGFLSGLLGIGGGVLMVPALLVIFAANGFPEALLMHIVIATSLATVVCNSLCASIFLYFKKTPHWSFALKMVPGLVLGAYVGARLNHVFDTKYLKILFGIFVIAQGFYLIYAQVILSTKQFHGKHLLAWPWILLMGLGVGTLAGLIGLGGGVFLVPLFIYLGFSIREASATALVSMVPTVLVGALSSMYLSWRDPALPAQCLGYIYWPAVVTMGAMSICTAPLGIHLAHKLPVAVLKKGLGIFLVLVGILMLK